MGRRNTEIVTASEIADFVFCAEAWRLSQIGHESSNQRQRASGTTHHAHKALAERLAGVFIALGRLLIVFALLALAALLALNS